MKDTKLQNLTFIIQKVGGGGGEIKNKIALNLNRFCFVIIREFQFESAEEEKSICEVFPH